MIEKINKSDLHRKVMVVSLDNIPKDSQVLRFITSGKRGRCKLCNKMVEKLEAHHICYSPELTIKLCHNCHHKVHFWPNRLSDLDKLKLLSLRFPPLQAQKIINEKILGIAALARLIAPSRSAFIHVAQRIEQKKLQSSHSQKVRKLNKEVDISFLKRISPKKLN